MFLWTTLFCNGAKETAYLFQNLSQITCMMLWFDVPDSKRVDKTIFRRISVHANKLVSVKRLLLSLLWLFLLFLLFYIFDWPWYIFVVVCWVIIARCCFRLLENINHPNAAFVSLPFLGMFPIWSEWPCSCPPDMLETSGPQIFSGCNKLLALGSRSPCRTLTNIEIMVI